jgi:hypothetical protein
VYNPTLPRQDGPKLDASTHLDYRTRLGVAERQNLRWDLTSFGAASSRPTTRGT